MDLDWSSPDSVSPESFDRERHVRFLQMMYEILPSDYQGQEINRLTLAYFVVAGFKMLGAMNHVDIEGVTKWVLSLQAHPKNEAEINNGQFYGFHGSRSSQFPQSDDKVSVPNGSHLASTYCALATLKTVGYNMKNINSDIIMKSMKILQQPDGSFMPIHIGAERDLRFIFCAAAICSMLEDWSSINKEKAKEYVINCQSYDGGFGLIPGSESHGGGTYCAVASLRLMGFIEDDLLSKNTSCCIRNVPLLLDWCLQRQATDGGFQGRPNKPSDTCYAFWIGSVLRILGGQKFVNKIALNDFLLTCQSEYGGFSKFPGELPDLYHSFYGFSTFSMFEEPGTNPIRVDLGIAAADVGAIIGL